MGRAKKSFLYLLLALIGLPLFAWLFLPLFSSVTLQSTNNMQQQFVALKSPLFLIRMFVYALLIWLMPLMANVPLDSRKSARLVACVMLLIIEVVMVQRLWLF